MATKLLADPKVAKQAVQAQASSPKVASAIRAAAYDLDAPRRKRANDYADQRAKDKALPLPAYMARMVEKMTEWALGLAGLYDDLDTLPEGPGGSSSARRHETSRSKRSGGPTSSRNRRSA